MMCYKQMDLGYMNNKMYLRGTEVKKMVKVIKYGKKRRITCSNCGASLEFEKDDLKNVRTGVDVYEQQIVCPACNEIVSVQITIVD